MKFLPKIVLALSALAAGVAGAQTLSSQADQDRRARNREEALANYRASTSNATTDSSGRTLGERNRDRADTVRAKTHRTADKVRAKTHRTADKVRGKTHRTADKVRGFGHRQAEKARNFSDRQNARYGTNTKPNLNPEGGK